MNEILNITGRPALPFGLADRTCRHMVLRHVPMADDLFLLMEVRRILMPEGGLSLIVDAGADEVPIRRFAELSGLRPSPWPALPAPVAVSPGEKILNYAKPDRQIADSPRVSVAIPAWSPRFFEECLSSAVNQTYENLDILVCDDSPGTEIEEIANRLSRIRPVRYERNPVRLWGRGNYAKCLELAEGEFIKYLNDDDLLMPDCVERLIDTFRRAPDIALATSYRVCIDAGGNRLPDRPWTRPLVERDMVLHGANLANNMIMTGINVIGEPSTVLFRKADLLDIEPDYFSFDGVRVEGVLDMSMWSTLLLKGDCVYLREGLSRFRIHGDQRQSDPTVLQQCIEGIQALRAAWMRLGLHRHCRAGAMTGRRL